MIENTVHDMFLSFIIIYQKIKDQHGYYGFDVVKFVSEIYIHGNMLNTRRIMSDFYFLHTFLNFPNFLY